MVDFAAQPGDRYIKGAMLWGFADLVRSRGGDPTALAERVSFDRRVLTDFDGLISWSRACMLTELAAEELDMPSFGLEWALTIPPHFPNVGPAAMLASFCETIGEWARLCFQYWRFHTNAYACQLLLEPDGPNAIVRFHLEGLGFASRQMMELHLANATRMARLVTGLGEEGVNPVLVRFQHARPADISLHEALFQCGLEFGAPHYEVHFDRSYLDKPAKGDLKLLKSLVSWYIRYRIRHLPIYDQTMKSTVALAVQSMLGSGGCTLEFIAHSLGFSAKKLQRLLAQEGTSFSVILEDVREATARRLLAESDAPIAHVAGLLEYSSTAPFSLAFRRWSGMSPRAYRYRAKGVSKDDAEAEED